MRVCVCVCPPRGGGENSQICSLGGGGGIECLVLCVVCVSVDVMRCVFCISGYDGEVLKAEWF